MKGLLYLLLILQISLVFPQDFGNLSQQIRQQVQESLRGTQNLGQSISQSIRQSLHGYPLLPSPNFGRPIRPWQNFGYDISQVVNDELRPIHAMSIKNNMKNGVGGTTVVTYGTGKKLIIRNGQRYTCSGNIQRDQCNGMIQPFQVLSKQDFCYTSSFSVVNDHICLSTGPINVNSFNNEFNCRSSNGSPVVILTNQEYQDLCGQESPFKASYEYYANPSSPDYIAIPNPNPFVTCLNNEPNVCYFEDMFSGSGTNVSNQNGFSFSFSN